MTTHEADGLPSRYAPAEVETRRYEQWEKAGYFAPEAQENPDAPSYTIVLPPPNVTGQLHVGHALNHTLTDTLVRWHRMRGFRTLWLPGMDHAGIATQNVVERELANSDGKSRHDLGREAFIERVWEWKAEYGGRILGQMRRLGDSIDWSRERFTMDEGLSRAVQTMFKAMYDDGLIYRDNRIINWCPRCLTALSDIEVDHEDDDGELVSIRYGDGDARGEGASIVVATTRAETMLGDTAVAVHPDDERYAHLVGTTVELPLTGRRIPVVADAHVDPEFGTGAVKVTPAHDPNDFEIGRRHDLPRPTIMDEHGVVTAAGPFEGLDRFEARPAIVAALREEGRIVKEIRPYTHAVGHCSRCGTTVEPRLSLQWFVKVETLAKAAGDAVRDGRVKVSPPEMNARYFSWVDDMHDWCISRQLWWGHRIPVWYGPEGPDGQRETRCLGPDETAPEGWTQDSDVLDTWFSSGLWPFSTLGWPDETPDLAAGYPTSVLVTAYDILFFWVVRMMMFGLYANRDKAPADAVPFREVLLHGLVRDEFGKKMSKSKGNVVDPLDWIDRFGADAVRFSLARGSNPGSDTAVAEDWVEGARNFCNKLWNATRFALMNGAEAPGEGAGARIRSEGKDLDASDRWILSRLSTVNAEVTELLGKYEFGKASEALYHFVWDEFCDWYVELAKVPLFSAAGHGDDEAAASAQRTRRVLGFVLDQMLKLLHPVMPFVTDELWCALTGADSVMMEAWPEFEFADPAAETEITSLTRLVTEVRRFRSDQGVRPTQKIPGRLAGIENTPLARQETAIRSLLRLTPPEDGFATSASFETENVTVEIDLAGTVDIAAERRRLEKDLAAARKEVEQANGKLGNEKFMAKAPEKIVTQTRERLASAEADITRLEARLASLPEA